MPRKKKKYEDDIDLGTQTSYSDDDEDDSPRRRGKKFLTLGKVFVIFIFLLGVLIGGIITNQFVDPVLNSGITQDYNALLETNEVLDSQADSYYQCLIENGINPDEGC